MITLAVTSMTDALLDELDSILVDDPYRAVVRDLRADLLHGVVPAISLVAYVGDQLCGVGVASPPSAPVSPWTIETLVPIDGLDVAEALLDALLRAVPEPFIEWWTRGPLNADFSCLASARGLASGRRIAAMKLTDPQPEDPPQLQVRAFTAADASRVAEINNAAFAGHSDRSAWTDETVLTELHRLGGHYEDLLVAPSDEVRGLVWTRQMQPGVGEIYVLAVHPDAHGLGLGSALLDAGVAHLVSSYGTKVIMLYVDTTNGHASDLYQRRGFTDTDETLVSFIQS